MDRVLHVAALPFPSSQGTQAALRAIVEAVAEDAGLRGERVGLLTYEAGEGRQALSHHVDHRRTRAPVRNRSLRSGPSLAKVAEDVDLVRHLREAPETEIVAHHVEAGLACVLAGRAFTWVAHTALGPELPLYLPRRARTAWLTAPLSAAGEALDAFVAQRAQRVLAISPFLAARVQQALGVSASVLTTPWSPAPHVTDQERARARDALGFTRDHEVVLYAGNLDHYQGLDTALDALGRLSHHRGRLRWLVASESNAAPLRALAARAGVRLVVAPLASDEARRRAHAAADLAIVPRRLEAGISIKILEALAHGLPTIAVRASTGGFDFRDALVLVDDDPSALANAIRALLEEPAQRAALRLAGPAHLTHAHSAARALEVLGTVAAHRDR